MKMKKIICAIMVTLMAISCFNFSSVTYAEKGDLGEGYDLDIMDKEFEAVEGGTVSTGATGVVTILMFGKTDGSCSNSTKMIKWFCKASWINDERIRFVFVDYNNDSYEHIKSISDTYNCPNAKFTYCPDYTANNLVWKYSDTIQGVSKAFSIPLTVIKDQNNKVQYAFYGLKTPNQVRKYVEDLVGDTLKEPVDPDTGKPEGSVQFNIEGTYNEEEAMKVFEMINEKRSELGRGTGTLDATLMKRAMQRAAECAVNYGHIRPDGDEYFTVLDDWYINGCAENVAIGQKDAQEVMDAWMNSDGHRKNILNSSYDSIGVGCFEHNGVRYWVQLFSIVVDEEKTEAQNVTAEAVITAKKGCYGKAFLLYSGGVTVGKETKTVLEINNTTRGYAFRPSLKNFTFESTDTSILTVATSGAITGVAPGKASVNIKVDDTVIGTALVTVDPDPDQPSTPPASDVPASEAPATNKPGSSEAPATDQPGGTTNIDEGTGKTFGDSDMNGNITLQDAQMALKVALKLSSADEATIRIMSGGGDHVELKHAQTILKIALKLQKAFYE